PTHTPHLDLPSFPTRRSSDLDRAPAASAPPPAESPRDAPAMRARASRLRAGSWARADRVRAGRRAIAGAEQEPRPTHEAERHGPDRKSTRLNSSHVKISYAVF